MDQISVPRLFLIEQRTFNEYQAKSLDRCVQNIWYFICSTYFILTIYVRRNSTNVYWQENNVKSTSQRTESMHKCNQIAFSLARLGDTVEWRNKMSISTKFSCFSIDIVTELNNNNLSKVIYRVFIQSKFGSLLLKRKNNKLSSEGLLVIMETD